MGTRLSINRNSFSTWLLLAFFLMVLCAAFISELFQAPSSVTHQLNEYRSLLKPEDLASIDTININNRLGELKLKAIEGDWQIISPRKLKAKEAPIRLILNTIAEIKIRKVLKKDPINISNFSLDSPHMTIELTKSTGEKILLKLGLINPIDNSTYVSVSSKDAIYHVDALKGSLERLDLVNLIDSSVFDFNEERLIKFSVYKWNRKNKKLDFSLEKKDGVFVDNKKNKLVPHKVQSYFDELKAVRSSIILDERTPQLEEALKPYSTIFSYSIEITYEGGGELHFNASRLITKDIPGLKIAKKQNFLLTSSNRDHPFILGKELYKIFNAKNRKLKDLQIKKLFY